MDAPSYQQSRKLVLGTGITVLLVTAGALQLLAKDPVEVFAVILFLPVFVAAVLGGVRAGLAAAVVAWLFYVGLRWGDIQQFGWALLWTRLLAQLLGYLAFGGVGGWAAGVVGDSISKLDRFDVTDDDSELLNARGLHRQLEQEVARAKRYGSDYAVVTVTFELTHDKKETRRHIGGIVRQNVRTVDDIGRITVDGNDVIVAVLPETQREGAEIVGRKIAERLEADTGDVHAEVAWLTHPEDDEAVDRLLGQLEEVVRREHPEAVR